MSGWFDSKLPRFALKAAVVYAFFAGLWILATDQLVDLLSPAIAGNLQRYKGLLFVAITALLLYFLLRQLGRSHILPLGPDDTGAAAGELLVEARKKFGPAAPLVLFVVLAFLIGASGHYVYVHQKEVFRQHKENELTAIADLKVKALTAWLIERQGDAETVRRDTLLAEAVRAWTRAGKPAGAMRQRLLDRLGGYWLAYGYRSVLLLDEQGVPLLGTGENPDGIAAHERVMARMAISRKEVQISDFHLADTPQETGVELDLMAPLVGPDGQGAGVVYFRVDPALQLYPLLRTWPVPSETGEALLVRQEGDEVVFLNDLNKQPDAALKLRLPLARQNLPAALAVQGSKGAVEGKDYHGDPVLAVVRPIPKTAWFLVSKVDAREVFSDLNQLTWIVAALTGIFTAVAGLIIHLWWRRQRDGFLLREYRIEMERRQLAKRLDILSRHANDGIFLMDEHRRFLDFNERVESLYGFSREELLSMEAADLRPSETKPALEDDWRQAEAGESGGVFETLHRRKDGTVFPVEISLRRIDENGQTLHLGVVRDIGERRTAEAKILRLKNLYAALSQSNEAIIHLVDEEALFPEICRVAVEQNGFLLAWVGMVGEGGWVEVKAASGPARDYVANLKVRVDGSVPEGRGPTGTAVREGRTFLCNDFMADPATLPWQERAARFGIRSAAAFPLRRGGTSVGALTLYAAQEGFFDPGITALLEEMAGDISFALDHFDQEQARRRAEEQLAESAARQRAMLDNIPDIAWLKDRDSRYIAINQPFADACGKSNQELAGGTDFDIWPYQLAEAYRADDAEVMKSRRRKQVEEDLVTAEGRRLWIDTVKTPIFNAQGEVVGTAGIARDITGRKEAEERIIRLSNFYATLSQTNQAIVRSKGRQELFEEVCRIAVAYGKVQAAFIRTVETANHRAVAIAHYGPAHEGIAAANISLDGASAESRGPTAAAMLEGVPFISNDFLHDPSGQPWRELSERLGIRAVAAFPLYCEEKVEGALTLYADEVDFFNQQMVDLLQEMAVDISFAMDNFVREEKRRVVEAALQESRDRYRSLFDNMLDGFSYCQMLYEDDQPSDFVYLEVNPAFERLTGLKAVEGKKVSEVIPGIRQTNPELFEVYGRVAQSGKPERFEAYVKALDIWFSIAVYSPERGSFVAVFDNVTERMEALEKLRLDAKVFEESAEGIMITDADLHILAVNRTFTAITGYREEEVIGTRPSVLRSKRHDLIFFQNMWAAINETGHWVGEIWNRRKDGELFPAWLSISAAKDEQGKVSRYIGMFSDISTRKEAEERIRHLIHYDALTNLPNQFLLGDHIALALAHARRVKCFVAVMVVNLDRFRSVNERYGHAVGDRVLQEIATRLLGLLREGDTVARMGADNFAIVMPDLQGTHQATAVAGRVLETVAEPIRFDDYEISLTARVGVALFPADGDRAELLLQNADIALANAKAAGMHNFVFFTPEQSRELEETLAMEAALRHAIERNELRLHYQPRLDLLSGGIVAVEALVRWQHPEQGLLPPGKFIALAEQTGLIVPLGEWVLREACRQVQEWHQGGFVGLRVSVNVSVLQLRQRNLVQVVQDVLRETGLNPTHLELEFTESFLMEDVEGTVATLRKLKDIGLHFSIDDFGTGYSSLSYLKLFPIDMLKVDQSFVRDVTFDASDAAIVQGMIALGHSLKLKMVAEGVETEAQMGYLRSIHCDEMQGFFYSRPLPDTQMYALLQSNKRLQDITSIPGTVRKLLLVDDEPNITTALNRLLRREGYQILIAHSAREALETLAVNADVGVVLSDQRMPEMSGIELLSKVKVLYPGIVRIILSGYTELNTVTDAINKGEIYKFLTKPWEDDQLREVVREAFLRFELAKAEKKLSGEEKKQ